MRYMWQTLIEPMAHTIVYLQGAWCGGIETAYMLTQSMRPGKVKQLCLKTTPSFPREKEELPQARFDGLLQFLSHGEHVHWLVSYPKSLGARLAHWWGKWFLFASQCVSGQNCLIVLFMALSAFNDIIMRRPESVHIAFVTHQFCACGSLPVTTVHPFKTQMKNMRIQRVQKCYANG